MYRERERYRYSCENLEIWRLDPSGLSFSRGAFAEDDKGRVP